MKLWKRNAVVAAIVLFVCVAVYLNWSYDQGSSVSGAGSLSSGTTGKTLGEAALVNSDDALELEDNSAEPDTSAPADSAALGDSDSSGSAKGDPPENKGSGKGTESENPDAGADGDASSSDYFATARLNREEARDNSLSILKETVNDPEAAKEAVSSASESITAMASATLQESKIESLVTAKGYEDCVAFIGDNSVSVVVRTGNGELKGEDVAKITDIVVGETKFAASDVKVIAENG